MLKKLFSSDDGQALVEYSLIISLIVIVAVVALIAFGRELLVLYQSSEKKIIDGLGGK